jgi:hypothetical protein
MLVPNLIVINYQNPQRGRMHLHSFVLRFTCAPRLLPTHGWNVCSAPTARPWMQLRAPRLLPAHGCNFMLHACCHAHGYNFVLHVCYRARFASHAHDGTAVSERTTFACTPLSRLLMKHLQHKTISYNICSKQIKHLQHTLATCVCAL